MPMRWADEPSGVKQSRYDSVVVHGQWQPINDDVFSTVIVVGFFVVAIDTVWMHYVSGS